MFVILWLILVFVLGVCVGSFINVAAARLPLEKSLLWPGSRCGSCLQRIRWYDNLPLISYLWLRGKCRQCGESFSVRYFLVELVSGLGFAGLFAAEMIGNVHDWPVQGRHWAIQFGVYPIQWWIGFLFHGVLFSFLLTAAVCDLSGREIPIQLTLTGALVGLIGAVLWPWPWPWTPNVAAPLPNFNGTEWQIGDIRSGVYLWPVWGPLPQGLAPGGNWQTGLITGLVGGLVGSFLLRGVRVLASAGLGKEGLGLGDADLMMMAGCFLGWQPVVVAFFLSPLPALVVACFQLFVRGDHSLPYVPSLAIGLIVTLLCWRWIGPSQFVQPVFFSILVLIIICVLGPVLLFGLSYLFRFLRAAPE